MRDQLLLYRLRCKIYKVRGSCCLAV